MVSTSVRRVVASSQSGDRLCVLFVFAAVTLAGCCGGQRDSIAQRAVSAPQAPLTSEDKSFVEHSLRTIASACLLVYEVDPGETIHRLVTDGVILDELARRGLIPGSMVACAGASAREADVFRVSASFASMQPELVHITDDVSHWVQVYFDGPLIGADKVCVYRVDGGIEWISHDELQRRNATQSIKIREELSSHQNSYENP